MEWLAVVIPVISTVLDFIIKILIIVFLMELIIAVRKRNESNKQLLIRYSKKFYPKELGVVGFILPLRFWIFIRQHNENAIFHLVYHGD